MQDPATATNIPAPTAGMTTKVVKGSIWTLAGQVVPLAVSLVATPFVIRLFGAEGYGVLILIGLIPAYLGFADLGMSIASTKFASEAYAEGDREKEARTVRTAALLAFLSSAPVALALIAFSYQIVELLNVPAHLLAEASLALKIVSVTFVFTILGTVFNSPELTRLRMDLNTFVGSGFRTLGIIATPVVIYLGGGLAGAATVLFIVSLLTLAGHVFISGRLLPNLSGITVDSRLARPLIKYGLALAVAGIATVLLSNLEKVVLAKVTSVETLAYYSVAFTLAFTMTLFSVAMAQSLIPAFSQLQGVENRRMLSSLYSRGIWMNVIWLIPVLVILAVFAKPLFTLWAGKDFGRESVLPFYILLFGIGLHVVATPARAAIMASGRSDIMAKLAWIKLIPYIGLVWILTQRFGAAGAAAAWSTRAVADALISFTFAKRISRINFISRDPWSFGLALLVMLIPLVAVCLDVATYLLLTGLSLVSIVCYVLIVWRLILNVDEVVWLKRVIFSSWLKTQ